MTTVKCIEEATKPNLKKTLKGKVYNVIYVIYYVNIFGSLLDFYGYST